MVTTPVGNLTPTLTAQQKKDMDKESTRVDNPTFDTYLVNEYAKPVPSGQRHFVTRSRQKRFGHCLPPGLMALPCALLTIQRGSATTSVPNLLIMSPTLQQSMLIGPLGASSATIPEVLAKVVF